MGQNLESIKNRNEDSVAGTEGVPWHEIGKAGKGHIVSRNLCVTLI